MSAPSPSHDPGGARREPDEEDTALLSTAQIRAARYWVGSTGGRLNLVQEKDAAQEQDRAGLRKIARGSTLNLVGAGLAAAARAHAESSSFERVADAYLDALRLG